MADDSVVLEFLANVDSARQDLANFITNSEEKLNQLAKSGKVEILVDVARAQVSLDALAKNFAALLSEEERARGAKIEIDASEPLAVVAELVARVEEASAEIAALAAEAAAPLSALEASFLGAREAVDDFAARSVADSETFGRGFAAAALQARIALEELEAQLLAARESGSGVTQADIERLLALRQGYANAVVGAGEFVSAQESVKAELAGEASVLETAQIRLEAYLALLRAAGGSLTPLQAATRGLEGALLELDSRLNSTSANFGQGLPAAAQRAAAALFEVRSAMEAEAATPSVSEQQLARIRELEALYESLILKLRELKVAQGQANESVAGGAAAAAGLGNKFQELAGYVNLYLATKIAEELHKLATAALEAEVALERINAQLLQATGSAKEAADGLQFLRESSETLGAPLQEAAQNFSKLQISAAQTNLTSAETRQLFVGLGAAAAGLRLPVSESTALFSGLSDALARGALDTRTLRAIAVTMPGVMQELSQAFLGANGRVEDFRKQVTAGNIPIEDFVRQLAPILIAQYRDQLPEAVRSTQSELNRLHNTQFEFSASLASEFTPALREAIDRIREWGRENANISEGFGLIGKLLLKTVEVLASSAVLIVRAVETALYGILASVTGLLARAGDLAAHFNKSFAGTAQTLHDFADSFAEESEIAAHRVDKLGKEIGDAFSGATTDTKKLDNALGNLLASAGSAAPAFDITIAAIGRSVVAIKEYDAEITKGLEPPTREAADKIVKDIDAVVKAIQQLPVAQREAQAGTLREVQVLRGHYEEFTSAYIKLQEQRVKAAEEAEKKHAALLQKEDDGWQHLLASIEKVESAEAKAANAKISALQQTNASDKARLDELNNKPLLTVDEINEQETLRKKIDETTESVKKLQAAQEAGGQAGAQVTEKSIADADKLEAGFRKLIATDDVLRNSIASLGPAGRDALGGLLQQLVDLQRQGGGTKQQVDDITQRIVKLAQDGGAASANLAERLGLVTDKTKSLRGEMAALTPAAAAAGTALSNAGASGQTAAGGLNSAAGAAHGSAEALKEQAAAAEASKLSTETLGETTISVAAKSDGLTQSQYMLRGSFDQTGGSAGAMAQSIGLTSDRINLLKASTDNADPVIEKVSDRLNLTGKNANTTAGNLTTMGKSVDGLKTSVDAAGSSTDHLGTSAAAIAPRLDAAGSAAKSVGTGASSAAAGVGSLAVATGAAVPAVSSLSTVLTNISSLKIGDQFVAMGAGLATAATGATRFADNLKPLLTLDTAKLDPLAKRLQDIGHGATAAAVAEERLNAAMTKAIPLCNSLTACLLALAGAGG